MFEQYFLTNGSLNIARSCGMKLERNWTEICLLSEITSMLKILSLLSKDPKKYRRCQLKVSVDHLHKYSGFPLDLENLENLEK